MFSPRPLLKLQDLFPVILSALLFAVRAFIIPFAGRNQFVIRPERPFVHRLEYAVFPENVYLQRISFNYRVTWTGQILSICFKEVERRGSTCALFKVNRDFNIVDDNDTNTPVIEWRHRLKTHINLFLGIIRLPAAYKYGGNTTRPFNILLGKGKRNITLAQKKFSALLIDRASKLKYYGFLIAGFEVLAFKRQPPVFHLPGKDIVIVELVSTFKIYLAREIIIKPDSTNFSTNL